MHLNSRTSAYSSSVGKIQQIPEFPSSFIAIQEKNSILDMLPFGSNTNSFLPIIEAEFFQEWI